jgi:hypothetical protein
MSPDELLTLLEPDAVRQLDRLARDTGRVVALDAVRSAFESDERFRVPAQIKSSRRDSVDLETELFAR